MNCHTQGHTPDGWLRQDPNPGYLLSHPQQPGFMNSPLPGGRVLTTAWLSLSHGACFSLTLSGLEKRSGQASPSAYPAMGPNFRPTPLFHPRTL